MGLGKGSGCSKSPSKEVIPTTIDNAKNIRGDVVVLKKSNSDCSQVSRNSQKNEVKAEKKQGKKKMDKSSSEKIVITTQEVKFTVTDEQGKERNFNTDKTGNYYIVRNSIPNIIEGPQASTGEISVLETVEENPKPEESEVAHIYSDESEPIKDSNEPSVEVAQDLDIAAKPALEENETEYYPFPKLGKLAPDFKLKAVVGENIEDIQLSDYLGKYVVLLFYPYDFYTPCMNELIEYSLRSSEFTEINCGLIALSTDSCYSHLAWINRGLGKVSFPLASDGTGSIIKQYGVYKSDQGVPFGALFIIDGDQKLRQIIMNDFTVLSNVDEVLRLVKAYKFTDENGEVCPAEWKPGKSTIKPDIKSSKEYFSSVF